VAVLFRKRKQNFYQMLTSCLMFFCDNTAQRRRLERERKLRMTEEDYSFYQDQKGPRVAKCLDVLLPLTSSDKQFMRRSEISSNLSSSSACHSEMETESAADYVSESESTCAYSSQSCTADEFVAESSNIPASSQNRRKWSNLARMCERYQVSDRAAAAAANSVLEDVGMVTDDDKTCVIDRSKLRREREDAGRKSKTRSNKTSGL